MAFEEGLGHSPLSPPLLPSPSNHRSDPLSRPLSVPLPPVSLLPCMSDDSPPLNFAALTAFIEDVEKEEEVDDPERHYWYEKLAEYEPEPGISENNLTSLFKAMQILARVSFTAEEVLNEQIKRDVEAAADRESSFNDQLTAAKEELDDLRERLVIGADVGSRSGGESLDAIRAQVTALKEENYQLQQINRERDRELADQRDRFESIMARAEALHRERDNLLYNRSQMEETVSDLKRKLLSKAEGGDHEWETKKLRLRNDQALQLTHQLNAVMSQNDTLRDEVTRVSGALEEATHLIETTTQRYNDLSTRLLAASTRIDELEEEKATIEREMADMRTAEEARRAADGERQIIDMFERNVEQAKFTIAAREKEIEELRSSLSALQSRLEWAEAKAEMGTEKEDHLEKLRVQLQRATKEAKSLLGYTPSGGTEGGEKREEGVDRQEEMRLKRSLMDSEHALTLVHSQLNECREELTALERQTEEKEKKVEDALREAKSLREIKFGDAAKTLTEMQQQLQFRDDQISRLTQQCSLLHVELGRYAQMEEEGRLVSLRPTGIHRGEEIEDPAPRGTPSTPKTRKKKEKSGETREEQGPEEIEVSPTTPVSQVSTRKGLVRIPGSVEEQALLISNLYYDSIALIDELETSQRQLLMADRVIDEGAKRLEECRAQLRIAYEHIASREKELMRGGVSEGEMKEEEIEMMKTENEQMKIFASSIRASGSELERRAEEMNRKLIGENLTRLRLSRRLIRMEKRLEWEETANRSLREKTLEWKSERALEIAQLQRQLDESWSEEARLQEMILQCVPRESYSLLHSKYRKLLTTTSGLDNENKTESLDSIVPDILPRPTTANASADMTEGLQRQLDHTKRLLSIVEDQSSYYAGEAESLRVENAEMRRLLEQCEIEDEPQALMVSMQTHLLRVLRDEAIAAREGIRAKEQLRQLKEATRKTRGERASERRHLIAVARLLHTTLQRSQTEVLHGISVSQVEQFRDKIGELMEKEKRIGSELEKTESSRLEMESLQRKMLAMRETLDMVKEGDGDRVALERTIHSLISREREIKDKLSGAESEISDLRSEVRKLRHTENSFEDEKNIVLEQIGAFLSIRESREETREENEGRRRDGDRKDQRREDRKMSIPRPPAVLTTESSEHSKESEVETTDSERSTRGKDRVIVKTVVHDNSKRFEEKLQQMRDTAEVAIRSYQDQLSEKERALSDLRRMLEKKMGEVRVVEKVEVVKEIVRERDESTDTEMEQLRKERARLSRLVEELESSNRRLFDKSTRELNEIREITTQTEPLSMIREDTFADEVEQTNRTRGDLDESNRSFDESRRSVVVKGGERSRDDEILHITEQLEKAEDDLRRANTRFEYERRTNKETIAKLTKANKELSRACEEIKRVAMEEVRERMSGRGGTETGRSIDDRLSLAREESEGLRKTIDRLKKTIETMKREYDEERRQQSGEKVQVEQWHERKKFEETIDKQRREIKRLVTRDKAAESELAKREKRIADLESIERTRIRTITQMETQLRTVRREKSAVTIEHAESSDLRSKISLLEEQLMSVRMELNDMRIRNARLIAERREEKREMKKKSEETEKKMMEESEKMKEREREKSVKTSERKEINELRTKLSETQRQYTETRDKLTRVEKEYNESIERHKLIVTRLEKDSVPVSGIALLNDKLQAKELEIRNLKSRIADLERRKETTQ